MIKFRRLTLFAMLFVMTQHATAFAANPTYEFKLNGNPYPLEWLSLGDLQDRPEPGDATVVNGILLLLPRVTELNFKVNPKDPNKLYLEAADGTRSLVGVKIGRTFLNGERVVVNPLAELSAVEFETLKGVLVDHWDAEIARSLQRIKHSELAWTLTANTLQGETKELPPFSNKVRYLYLFETPSQAFADLSPLQALQELRFLAIFCYKSLEIDVRWIAQARNLRYLDLTGTALQHADKLGQLVELRHLVLFDSKEFADSAALKSLKNLRSLDLQNSAVRDLSGLHTLQQLTTLRANRTATTKLPMQAMPSLKRLELLGTPLAQADLDAFKAVNKDCFVFHSPNRVLKQLIADADRVNVQYSGLVWFTQNRKFKADYVEKDPAALRALAELIEVDDGKPSMTCLCSNGPVFDFFKGELNIATVALRHDTQIEWLGGELGNWVLSVDSSRKLAKWADQHKPANLEQEYEALPGFLQQPSGLSP